MKTKHIFMSQPTSMRRWKRWVCTTCDLDVHLPDNTDPYRVGLVSCGDHLISSVLYD